MPDDPFDDILGQVNDLLASTSPNRREIPDQEELERAAFRSGVAFAPQEFSIAMVEQMRGSQPKVSRMASSRLESTATSDSHAMMLAGCSCYATSGMSTIAGRGRK